MKEMQWLAEVPHVLVSPVSKTSIPPFFSVKCFVRDYASGPVITIHIFPLCRRHPAIPIK